MVLIPRIRRRFRLAEYGNFLQAAISSGIQFSLFDRDAMSGRNGRFHFVKHDIHDDLPNTIAMAELEASFGVRATYFMMPRHPLNRRFYDAPATWDGLRRVQSLGHEIALHIDGFELIESYGDLATGISKEREKFVAEGLRIRGGNTHGNTTYQKLLNFEPMNFYREVARDLRSTDPKWRMEHGKYSLLELGFDYWADTSVWYSPGEMIVTERIVTDNSTAWRMCEANTDWLMTGDRFQLRSGFISELLNKIKDFSCIYLVHPQFYAA